MTKPYHEYAKDYPAALASIADCLSRSHLSRLENIALRFAHAIEEKTLDLKDGNEREFLSAVLVKTTNEMFATVGSLRNGALLACYHHARSIIELCAALEHVYCIPSKRERKLEKFVEYPNVAKYLHYRDWQMRLSNGKVTKDEFAQGYNLSESEFKELEKNLPEWQLIWKLNDSDPFPIQNWHYPATIKNLFQSSEETKELWDTYEMFCHATHLSPLGERVTGGRFLIGFPRNGSNFDYRKINQAIIGTILSSQQITIRLHEVVKAGLIEGVLDWVPDGQGENWRRLRKQWISRRQFFQRRFYLERHQRPSMNG